jgi:hypothetical protein
MKITVTELGVSIPLTEQTTILEVHNTGSSTVYRGWEPATTASDDANQGLPLAADKAIVYGGHGVGLQRGNLYLITASGETTTVNYSLKT